MVALIVTVPEAFAVTKPDELTVATAGLPDTHVTFLLVAFDGVTVAVSWKLLPGAMVLDDSSNVIPVTETIEDVTVTAQVACLFPSTVATVMVAVPALLAVTKPDELTDATFALFDVHVTFLLVAFDGVTVAVS